MPPSAIRIDRIADEFESQWRIGDRPRIESYLTQLADCDRAPLLAELLAVEVELRVRNGEAPSPTEYTPRFPGCERLVAEAFACSCASGSGGNGNATQRATPPHGARGKSDDASDGGVNGDGALPTLAPGRRFGDYELLKELGRGGFGVVFKARQASLNRIVAVKVLRAGGMADEAEVRRFRQEAEAIARLDHPGIVAIHEVGTYDGRQFFSMEYVDGRSLADLVREHPLEPREAARLVQLIAAATHHAHERGILHRDLKPANVLVDRANCPRISDFGLAGPIEKDSRLTASGMFVGTPSYMSPEQARGSVRDLGPATDVYSLGAILYELLTGRPPVRAATPFDTLLQVLECDPVSPKLLNARVPRDLETICVKCLEKSPGNRYSSARALSEDLARYLLNQPIVARPVGAVSRMARWCQRNPMIAALVASVATLLLAVVVGSIVVAMHLERTRAAAVENLWAAYHAQARAGRSSARVGQRLEGLEALAKAAAIHPTLELRNEAIACMALPDLRLLRRWEAVKNTIAPVGFDSTLSRYARFDGDGVVTVRRTSDDEVVARIGGLEGIIDGFRFSRDGRLLALRDDLQGLFSLWNLADGKQLAPRGAGGTYAMDFTRDGGKFAIGLKNGSVQVFDLGSGALERTFSVAGEPWAVRFDPSGQRLAASCDKLLVWNLTTGDAECELVRPGRVLGVDWHPDGRMIAAGCNDYRIFVWNLSTDGLVVEFECEQEYITDVVFHPDGDFFAASGWNGKTELWDPLDRRMMLRVDGNFPTFSSDGTQLAMKEGLYATTWELTLSHQFRALYSHSTKRPFVYNASFDAAGRLLATASDDGVRIWSAHGRAELAHLPVGPSSNALFDEPHGGLITCGTVGLQFWPIKYAVQGATATIGPPTPIALPPGTPRACAMSADAGTLAVALTGPNKAVVIDRLGRRPPTFLTRHPGQTEIAIAPNGQWVATGNWHAEAVYVYDSQQQVKVCDAPGSATACFSPDSRWMAVATGARVEFLKCGSWEKGIVLSRDGAGDFPAAMAFSSDGRVFAYSHSRYRIRLIDVETGGELASLEAPNQRNVGTLAFSPDGSLLAATCLRDGTRVWDIRRIRESLGRVRLDWDMPGFDAPANPTAVIPSIEVRLGAVQAASSDK